MKFDCSSAFALAVSIARNRSARHQPARPRLRQRPRVPAAPRCSSSIRFEDATRQSGIDFTHSFGSRQLGSLLEGTGAGCVWFDYNNSGLPSLYVVNGRPLDDSCIRIR